MEAAVLEQPVSLSPTTSPFDPSALIEVGVGTLQHNVSVLVADGSTSLIKEELGIADAMRVASLHSRNDKGYAKVIYKSLTVALYYKGELT